MPLFACRQILAITPSEIWSKLLNGNNLKRRGEQLPVAGGNRGHRQHKGSAALVVKDDTQLEQCEIEAHCLPRVATTIRICRFDADEGHRCRETKQADTGITNDLPTLTLHHVMKGRMPPVFPQILSQELHCFMELAMDDVRARLCRPCRSQTINPDLLC